MHLVPFSVSCWDVSTKDAVKRGLLVISAIPWQMGEIPECWKKGNVSPIIRKGKKGGSRELQTCEPGADRPWEGDGWVEVARMDLQREPSLTNLRDTSRELVDVGAPSWKAALRDGPGCWADRGPEARPCGRGGHQLKSCRQAEASWSSSCPLLSPGDTGWELWVLLGSSVRGRRGEIASGPARSRWRGAVLSNLPELALSARA